MRKKIFMIFPLVIAESRPEDNTDERDNAPSPFLDASRICARPDPSATSGCPPKGQDTIPLASVYFHPIVLTPSGDQIIFGQAVTDQS